MLEASLADGMQSEFALCARSSDVAVAELACKEVQRAMSASYP